MDVTSIIDFNERLVNDNLPRLSFFCLKKDDPAAGFPFDASQVAGHVYGEKNEDPSQHRLLRRLILGNLTPCRGRLSIPTPYEERLAHAKLGDSGLLNCSKLEYTSVDLVSL